MYIYIYVCYGLLTVYAWWYSYAWQKRRSKLLLQRKRRVTIHTHISVLYIRIYMYVMVCLPFVRGGTHMPGRNGVATPSAKKASRNYSHTYKSVLYIYTHICVLWFAYRLCVVVLACLAETKERLLLRRKRRVTIHTHIYPC